MSKDSQPSGTARVYRTLIGCSAPLFQLLKLTRFLRPAVLMDSLAKTSYWIKVSILLPDSAFPPHQHEGWLCGIAGTYHHASDKQRAVRPVVPSVPGPHPAKHSPYEMRRAGWTFMATGRSKYYQDANSAVRLWLTGKLVTVCAA
jgi:hypothetical protein